MKTLIRKPANQSLQQLSSGLSSGEMKPKPRGKGLEMRTFQGKDGNTFLVFKTLDGSYHVFGEVNAKDVAENSFGELEGNTRRRWRNIWNS